jgi:hypothetical protein
LRLPNSWIFRHLSAAHELWAQMAVTNSWSTFSKKAMNN